MTTSPDKRGHGLTDWLLALLFLAALILPTMAWLTGLRSAGRSTENRALAPFPAVALSVHAIRDFPRDLQAWFDDRFGFRVDLIRAHNRTYIRLFHVSPLNLVMLGRDGWLYYNGVVRGDGDPVADARGLKLLTPRQLDRWEASLTAQANWLKRRGISYVLVIAPNKSTIYPEHMPRFLPRVGTISVADQMVGRAVRVPGVRVLDLRPVLAERKAGDDVYFRTDSHWNAYGVWSGYQALCRTLRDAGVSIQPVTEADVRVVRTTGGYAGDLARMLNLDDVYVEDRTEWSWQRPVRHRLRNLRNDGSEYLLISDRSDAARPRAVVFRDSFATAMVPLLAETFGRAVYLWSPDFHRDAVESEQPDVVIRIVAERLLRKLAE